jgi:hypothetical protein
MIRAESLGLMNVVDEKGSAGSSSDERATRRHGTDMHLISVYAAYARYYCCNTRNILPSYTSTSASTSIFPGFVPFLKYARTMRVQGWDPVL